ncbi:MAG: 4-(cytidine 5'-diphospho)-2-C-methyl-D-erythritol kinase [Marinilabiliales bacterium]|nr:MAG: 4-(cytidine 5'-diphospho)-2-C-methyl-D-erythritol kinase [Marinilabiliales bacterium]
MIVFSNAKINIGLHITAKRDDGYHNIETLFYPVRLADIIEILPVKGKGDHLLVNTGDTVDADPSRNLCIKALDALDGLIETRRLKIHLHKLVPQGAGLGGGSSNAAFVLMAANRILEGGLDRSVMASVAGSIGSDCPFFIHNRPLFAHGRGDQFEPSGISLAGYIIVIVFPGIRVNTAWAYAMVKPEKNKCQLREVLSDGPETWRGRVINDFELPVFRAHPEIGKVKRVLEDSGALYASLTGSGGAVYGIFSEKSNTRKIIGKFAGMFVWSGALD